MKILQVCAYAAPYEGNFIKSLKMLQNDLIKDGYETIYAFPESAKGIQWCKELEKTNDVYYLPLAQARFKLKTYTMLKAIYKKYPDLKIIHSHFELYDIPVSLTAPKNIKVYWHLHDAISNYKDLKNRIIHKLQYKYLARNSKLLSVSEKHMNYVLDLGFSKENAVFVPNGLNLDRIKLVKKDVNERKYDFLIFGWEYERKGVDLSLKALELLNNKYRLAIVSNDVTKKIVTENHNNLENVFLLDPVDDINTLFSESKCFLHISRAEGLSYALLEALYSGLNVICSDIQENMFASIFPNVIMTENENIEMIANKMDEIITNNNTQDIDITRNIIESEYSIQTWVKNIKKEYGMSND